MNENQKQSDQRLVAERRQKLHQLKREGKQFAHYYDRSHYSDALQEKYADNSKIELEQLQDSAAVCGRIMLKRGPFMVLQDQRGRIQIYANKEQQKQIKQDCGSIDIGDIVGASGSVQRSGKGDLYVDIADFQLLNKTLRPLPEKHAGLENVELRYRMRYVDLIVNRGVREVFQLRSRIVREIRQYFDNIDYLEVETPMLHSIASGAAAKPFATHHNALDQDMYLRVAPELNLKRLTVGGLEKVYEINRCFRNEGLSVRHNPEFTTLEFYEAYRDYHYLMDLTEDLLRQICQNCLNSTSIQYAEHTIDFGAAFTKLTVNAAVLNYNSDLSEQSIGDTAVLRKKLEQLQMPWQPHWGVGKLQIEIFEKTVEHRLIQPTFIIDYPREVSPLSRSKSSDPDVTERFELFVAGSEIANGFSELNDPEEQSARFADQLRQKEQGDEEAMGFDKDYIRALEFGMPPTAGEGLGIDRLIMLLTDSASIKDVLLFPALKAED